VETLYGSGIRCDELISAKLADLNLEQRSLSVLGKGSKARLVPLGRPAASILREYLSRGRPRFLRDGRPTPHLFIGRTGDPLTRQRVWQVVREHARRVNLNRVSPHVLRHSAATHMLDHGADLRTIQTVLGHAEISTTEIYTKVSGQHLHEAMLRHPRSNPARAQMVLFRSEASVLTPGPNPCAECAGPVVEGKTRCARHLLLSREAGKRFLAKKRARSVGLKSSAQSA